MMKSRWLRWLGCAALLSCGWSIEHRNPALQERLILAPETCAEAFDRFMLMPPRELLAEYERLATNPTDEMTFTPDVNISLQQMAVILAILVRGDELEKALGVAQ